MTLALKNVKGTFLLDFSRASNILKEFAGKPVHEETVLGGKNMTCLLQSYFPLDEKYSFHKWAFSFLRWCSHSELQSEQNGRWIAITHDWVTLYLHNATRWAIKSHSVRSSALRISYSANGISSAMQTTRIHEMHTWYHLVPVLTFPSISTHLYYLIFITFLNSDKFDVKCYTKIPRRQQ